MAIIFIIFIFVIVFVVSVQLLARKLQGKKKYHPIGGTVFHHLLNFNRLHDYMTDLARKYKTYRMMITPFRSEIYTSDPANVEYMLKTNFDNYAKGNHNYSILKDLLGDGIFTVDGDKWREQRKVSSYEFSTRVLRDFSSVVFRENAERLAGIISEAASTNEPMDIQDLFMKAILDSIFKVAFGVELDTMCGSNEEGAKFSNAFDDASAMTTWRYVDISWRIKKAFGFGSEAKLKKSIKVIDEFVYKLISIKTENMHRSHDDPSGYYHRLHDYMTDLARKHKTYRLMITPFLFKIYTSDPANVEYVLKTNFDNYGKGNHNYRILKDLLGDGIFAVDGDKWREQRKVSSYEISTRVLRDFSSVVFRKNAVRLAGIISEAAFTNEPMDIQDLFMKASLDSIFKVAFGVELDTMFGKNEEGTNFRNAIDDASAMTTWRYVDMLWRIKRALGFGSEAKLKKNLKVIDEFFYKLISSKTENMHRSHDENQWKKEDIMSRFLQLNKTEPKYLRDIILNFVIAGKDTTATAMSWFVYMLCKNLLVQEKVAKEIKHATVSSDMAKNISEFGASLSEESLGKMHYLHAALTETLRLYPAVLLDLFMKASLDSIFKVAFRVDLDTMCGTNEEGSKFSKAFDDASAMTTWRYVDISWRIKRAFGFGSEAKLKKSIKLIDEFVYKLISSKTENMHRSHEDPSLGHSTLLLQFLQLKG